jgi:hypothetical protein
MKQMLQTLIDVSRRERISARDFRFAKELRIRFAKSCNHPATEERLSLT